MNKEWNLSEQNCRLPPLCCLICRRSAFRRFLFFYFLSSSPQPSPRLCSPSDENCHFTSFTLFFFFPSVLLLILFFVSSAFLICHISSSSSSFVPHSTEIVDQSWWGERSSVGISQAQLDRVGVSRCEAAESPPPKL